MSEKFHQGSSDRLGKVFSLGPIFCFIQLRSDVCMGFSGPTACRDEKFCVIFNQHLAGIFALVTWITPRLWSPGWLCGDRFVWGRAGWGAWAALGISTYSCFIPCHLPASAAELGVTGMLEASAMGGELLLWPSLLFGVDKEEHRV